MNPNLLRRAFAEFVGSLLLLAAVVGSGLTISDRKLGFAAVKPAGPPGPLHLPDSIANILFLNIADYFEPLAHNQSMIAKAQNDGQAKFPHSLLAVLTTNDYP
jgi:hypothetical protein